MDAIVLAAGRNDRLKGVVPAYMKPLLLRNGRPLIGPIVHELSARMRRVIIVCSPHNAAALTNVIEHQERYENIVYVVQPHANGPRGAVAVGLEVADEDTTMIVCGDNVIPHDVYTDIIDLSERRHSTMTVFKTTDEDSASRFARIKDDRHGIIEHNPGGRWQDGAFRCWLGPVVVNTNRLRQHVHGLYLGEKITVALEQCGPFKTLEAECTDIGVPESLTQGGT